MTVKINLIKIINATLLIIFFVGSINAQVIDLMQLAEKEERKGNFGMALDYYKKALEDKKQPFLYIKIGRIYEENIRNNVKALEIYKNGLEKFPMDFYLNVAAMQLIFEFDQIDEGINKYIFLSKIKNQNARYTFPSYFLYRYKDKIGDVEFISFCQKYLKINPADFELRNYLAEKYLDKGDTVNAINELEILIKEKDNYHLQSDYFNLGICYCKINKYNDALEYLQKAIELEEGMPKRLIQKQIDAIKEKIKAM
jgi:tetratricopeptide (TPR) repeat protein